MRRNDALIIVSMVTSFKLVANYGQYHPDDRFATGYESWHRRLAGPWSTDKQSTSMISQQRSKLSFRKSKAIQQHTGTRTILATPLLREGVAIGAICDSSNRGPSLHGQTDQLAQNLR